jgi:hypothetical protein
MDLMLTEIVQTLLKLSRSIVWKILPESVTNNIDPDSSVGDTICIVFILLITLLVMWLVMAIGEQFAIDSCLDLGGKWDYEINSCIIKD